MRANEMRAFQMALDAGVRTGLSRALKHRDGPLREPDEQAVQALYDAIESEFFEWFLFDPPPGGGFDQ